MRENGLFHRYHRKYVQTTDSEHDLLRAPNLLQRHFDDFGINEAWCGDITYIPTNEGLTSRQKNEQICHNLRKRAR